TQVAWLEGEIDRLNAELAPLKSFILPGGSPVSAYLHLARTVCRRAERLVVGLIESGMLLQPNILRYLNRLSDLLWLFGRQIERAGGKDARLRGEDRPGPKWSRAW
ncbi:MAG: ATP:cob(I)alamin adenosyltransferase, partial [Bryobacteraceae bacterium]